MIHPKLKEVTYLNPMGELSGRNEAILKHWKSFLTMLSPSTRSSHKDADEWKMAEQAHPHPKQQDSVSCGVFVLECWVLDIG